MSTTPPPAPRRVPVVALVPLRAPGEGKSRLAGVLTVAQRARLATAMAADVVATLRGADVDRIVVVADGPIAAEAATTCDAEVLHDPPAVADAGGARRLDVALAAAAARIGPVPALLVVAADLPHLGVDDVTVVLDTDAEVVVAPTRDGGTGGLLRRPGDACGTGYGPGSAARHLALARAAGRRVAEVVRDGFALDVDVTSDLGRLGARGATPVGPHTAAVVDELAGTAVW